MKAEKELKEKGGAVVLLAEDDQKLQDLLARYLGQNGYHVILASDGYEAMARISEDVSVAIFDLMMPKASGLECLRYALNKFPDIPILVMSGYGEVQDAVRAVKQGAFHYLCKPFQFDEFLVHIQQALRSVQLVRENHILRQAVGSSSPPALFTGKSPALVRLLEKGKMFANLDPSILITGESGVGKTTLARMIHQLSPRASKPFVAVSCATLPGNLVESELFGHERGAFTGAVSSRLGRAEMAHGGTLFLDEIGDLPLELQPKLLTFLEDRLIYRVGGSTSRKVDVRFIAATHQNLSTLCEKKMFRADLHYRLNVLALTIPPLRERPEDILLLIDTILTRIARERRCPKFTVTPEAQSVLMQHHWAGNVRELENVLERASAISTDSVILKEVLNIENGVIASPPNGHTPKISNGLTLREMERSAIIHALEICRGKKSEAARQLGISEKSIYNKMKRHGLSNLGKISMIRQIGA